MKRIWKHFATLTGVMILLFGAHGCGRPGGSVQSFRDTVANGNPQEGIASWYGPGFDGRKTASGEIFNTRDLTAAHRTAPFGTAAVVTNLDNGKQVQVRINDRGPFVDGRVIDLSAAAADAIAMRGTGTAHVSVRFILAQNESLPEAAFFVQAGAFAEMDNAARLMDKLREAYPQMSFFLNEFVRGSDQKKLYRVRSGPYVSMEEARKAGKRMTLLDAKPYFFEERSHRFVQ